MVHEEDSRRKKLKPRGRPFPKNNKQGKPKLDLLDTSGHEISHERGVIAPIAQLDFLEPLNANEGVFSKLPDLVMDTMDKILKENMQPEKKEDLKELELIETIEFKEGENKLEIRFSKRHNRMYRIQIFLNDEIEIRPVTYTGTSTGKSYWNLLKNSLKKVK